MHTKPARTKTISLFRIILEEAKTRQWNQMRLSLFQKTVRYFFKSAMINDLLYMLLYNSYLSLVRRSTG